MQRPPKIRLQQTFGANSGRVFEVPKSVARIGRHPSNDIAFHPSADLDASGHHAEIRLEEQGWVIVDLASRNGTWRAGERITRTVVRVGDEIEFGPGGPRMRIALLEGVAGEASNHFGMATAETMRDERGLAPPTAAPPPENIPAAPKWVFVAGVLLAVIGVLAGAIAWLKLK